MLEELHRALVLLGGCAGREGSQVSAPTLPGNVVRIGGLRINPGGRAVERDGEPIHLTAEEFDHASYLWVYVGEGRPGAAEAGVRDRAGYRPRLDAGGSTGLTEQASSEQTSRQSFVAPSHAMV